MTPVGIAEAKAVLRIAHAEDDAAIAAVVRAATEMCEAYVGGPLIDREVHDDVAANGRWQLLPQGPVTQVRRIEWIAIDGSLSEVPLMSAAIDVDAGGVGKVRIAPPAVSGRVRVTYRAGLAFDWNGVPEAIRQGVVRLAAHLFLASEAPVAAVPAAVTALWRPWRKLRLC